MMYGAYDQPPIRANQGFGYFGIVSYLGRCVIPYLLDRRGGVYYLFSIYNLLVASEEIQGKWV